MSKKKTQTDLRLAILASNDLEKVVSIALPEWGVDAFLRPMDGHDLDAYEIAVGKGASDIRAQIAARTLCDKDGNRLFTDEDIPALSRKRGFVLDRIYQTVHKNSMLGTEGVVEAEKKSETEFKEIGSESSNEQEM